MNDYIGSLVAGGGGGGSDPSAMHYMGPVASAQDLPSSNNRPGDTYKASASFTITQGEPAKTIEVEAGDSIVWEGALWDVYQGNIEGAVTGPSSATNEHLAVFDGNSGKVIKDGGAVPEVWQLEIINAVNSASFVYRILKNKVVVTSGTFYARYYLNSNLKSSITITASDSNIFWIPNSTDFEKSTDFRFEIYEDSNYTNLLCFINYPCKSINIRSDYQGLVRADAVYNYSEAKRNKVTSIDQSSTDTQYPSALAVKNYVDTNGFNPANMKSVSDPITLNTPQSDWNQVDDTAPDYIKNKPLINDIYDVKLVEFSNTSLKIKVYKNYQVLSSTTLYVKLYQTMESSGSEMELVHGATLTTSQDGTLWTPFTNGSYSEGSDRYRVYLYADPDYTQLLVFKDFLKIAKQINSTSKDFVRAKQVYEYVSTQVGNIETLLSSI